MAKKPTTVRLTITLPSSEADFIGGEAKRRHAGNVSAAVAEAVRDARERNDSPFAPENALISDIKQTLRKLGLTYERDEKGIDWIVPELGLGIEAKTRCSNGTAEQRMIAAMAYSVGKGRCTEILIVGGEALSTQDQERLKAIAESFRVAKTSYVSIAGLAAVLSRLIAVKRGKPST